MDFNLIRQEDAAKVPFTVRLYATTLEKISEISTAEKVSVGSFVRHAINNAIADYMKLHNPNTEVR